MQLRREQQPHGAGEHVGRAHRVLRRPLRIEREGLREIFRPDELRLQRDQDADEQEQQPQRRRDVGPDAGQRDAAGSPNAARAPAARPRAAGCPGTSAGRAPRIR